MRSMEASPGKGVCFVPSFPSQGANTETVFTGQDDNGASASTVCRKFVGLYPKCEESVAVLDGLEQLLEVLLCVKVDPPPRHFLGYV